MVIVEDDGIIIISYCLTTVSNTVRNGRSYQIAVVSYLDILAEPECLNEGNRWVCSRLGVRSQPLVGS